MKNPDSLKITSVKIYEENKEDSLYPTVVTTTSGQNGFGGYAMSFDLFSNNDLTLRGSCDSLDLRDYNIKNDDDILESIIAFRIKELQKNEEVSVNIDIDRINDIVLNMKPNYNNDIYKESKTEA